MEPLSVFTDRNRLALLYHYCRLKLPSVRLGFGDFQRHLARTYHVYHAKQPTTPANYLASLAPLDWYLCSACISQDGRAWELLFATRTGQRDCLLVDALRARASRFYPRDMERQENVVQEFWTHLIVSQNDSVPILARYDGQRPLVPWLIRVFQNWLHSMGRIKHFDALPEDDIAPSLPVTSPSDSRWHDAFRQAAHEWLGEIAESDQLLLGLRWRYRMSQREVANLLNVNEGTITRRIDKLRDKCLDRIGKQLQSDGWSGEDLNEYILTEMASVLSDEPRLSADQIGRLVMQMGKELPQLLEQ